MTRGDLEGGRGGRQGRRLRVDRQHVGVGRGVRGTRRADLRGVIPDGPRRAGQARAGAHPRRQGRADPRQLRRRARRRARARRARRRRRSSTRSTRSASKARRPPRSRSCDALGDAPDVHCIPVGNAGNITAYWKGYREYARRRPRDAQRRACSAGRPRASAPLVLGEPVPHPETIATAIRIGNPATWDGAIAARDESGGAHRRGHRRRDPRRVPAARGDRGRVRRAGVGGVGRRAAARRRATGWSTRARPSCARSPGHGLKDPHRAIAEVDVGRAGRRDARRGGGRARPVNLDGRGDRWTMARKPVRSSPARRPGSARAFARALRRLAATTSCSSRATTAAARGARRGSSRRSTAPRSRCSPPT